MTARRRCLTLLCAAASLAMFAQAQPRLRPPPEVECPRDQLTLYRGEVIGYTRSDGRTTLRIRTEWQTIEQVVIAHPGSDDPSPWFRIDDAQPFSAADWPRIEIRKGRLRSGVRVAAWVCADARNPTLQWTAPG